MSIQFTDNGINFTDDGQDAYGAPVVASAYTPPARTESEWHEHFKKNELITTDDILGVLYRIPAVELRLIREAIDSHLID